MYGTVGLLLDCLLVHLEKVECQKVWFKTQALELVDMFVSENNHTQTPLESNSTNGIMLIIILV